MSETMPDPELRSLLPLYVGEDENDAERPFNQLPNIREQLTILAKVELQMARTLDAVIVDDSRFLGGRKALADQLASERLAEFQTQTDLTGRVKPSLASPGDSEDSISI
jgi:hypothetical protein